MEQTINRTNEQTNEQQLTTSTTTATNNTHIPRAQNTVHQQHIELSPVDLRKGSGFRAMKRNAMNQAGVLF